MHNRLFKHFISWLLIASPLWWTAGCYTRTAITNLDDAALDGLHVITNGGNHYLFHRWSWDSAGGIRGEETLRSTTWQGISVSRELAPMLPRDSIARTYSETLVEVVTRSGSLYQFTEWSSDRAGGIHGTARWRNPHYYSDDPTSHIYNEKIVHLPNDSVKSLNTVEFRIVNSIVTAFGITALTALVAEALAFSSNARF
jgi:hypothetical protein